MIGRILAVAGREVRSYFDHATAYILLVVFLAVNFFFFFREAYLLAEGSLRPMFGLLPWLLLFFVPAVTMRALAEERRSGTLELILAQPLSELEFLLGKFLGVMAFLAVAMAATLGGALGMEAGADLQWGVIAAQYTGSLFLLAGLVAVSLWASSLTRNQVTAFILGVAVTFLLYLMGLDLVLLGLPSPLALLAGRLAVLRHFESIARGVIDVRDVLYYVSLTSAFLALSYFALLREKLSHRRPPYRRLVGGTAALLALAVMVSLLGAEVRGRLDLTPGRVFTLSDATRRILGNLDDVVTVKFFVSRELPPEVAPVRRDVDDVLRDFDAAGGSNLRVVRLDPGEDEDARDQAAVLGIPPITFNVLGEAEVQVKKGYLGLAVQYAGESETVPVVQRTADLEYRLTSAIRSLTRERRPVVGFLRGHGEHDVLTDLRGAVARLRREYSVQSLVFDTAKAEVPDTVDVLVIAGPRQPLTAEEAAAVEAFAERGGSLLLLLPGMEVDRRSRFAIPASHDALDSLLARYGIRVVEGLAYDLRLNQRVPVRGEGGFTYILPYPLWPLVRPASRHVVVEELGPVLLPWPSPLELSVADTGAVVPLLATTEFGGRLEGPTSVDPTLDLTETVLPEELAPQVVAVAVAPSLAAGPGPGREREQGEAGAGGEAAAAGKTAGARASAVASTDGGEAGRAERSLPRGRLVVIGDADFVTDEFLQGNASNLRLVQNAVDWLAQDEALISIRSKDRTPPRLLFRSALARDAVKYGNLAGVPILFVLFGMLRLARRRRLQGRVYRPAGAEGRSS